MHSEGLRLTRISESMPEAIRQTPFLIGVFALSWWLFPDDVFEDVLEDLELIDSLLLAGSSIVFLIGCLTAYVVALELIPAD
jgi:hypothetical protein